MVTPLPSRLPAMLRKKIVREKDRQLRARYLMEFTRGEVEPVILSVDTIRAQRMHLRRVPSEGLEDELTGFGNATLRLTRRV